MTYVDAQDLGTRVNYASVYAQSLAEYHTLTQKCAVAGVIALQRASGDYYLLDKPLHISGLYITHCCVRKHDKMHHERGYVDFEVKDHDHFKIAYMGRSYFSLVTTGIEMLELRDPPL
jgi:hypothetical protein